MQSQDRAQPLGFRWGQPQEGPDLIRTVSTPVWGRFRPPFLRTAQRRWAQRTHLNHSTWLRGPRLHSAQAPRANVNLASACLALPHTEGLGRGSPCPSSQMALEASCTTGQGDAAPSVALPFLAAALLCPSQDPDGDRDGGRGQAGAPAIVVCFLTQWCQTSLSSEA